MIIIGITGTVGAGKGAIVDYLVRTRGFKHYSMRAFLVEELERRGSPLLRDNMLELGNEFRKNKGPGFLVEQFLEKAIANGQNAIIESIRSVGEIEVLRKVSGTILLAIDANTKTRYDRIVRRKSSTDMITFEKFIEDEQKESTSSEPWVSNVPKCVALADYVIHNNTTVDDLHGAIDKFLLDKNIV